MLLLAKLKGLNSIQFIQFPQKLRLAYYSHAASVQTIEIEDIVKLINDHPFPDRPLQPTLRHHITGAVLSTAFVENVLGRLFSGHTNGLKAIEFLKFSLYRSKFCPSSDAFEKALHILLRMRYFKKAWEFMEEIQQTHPYLLTLKSMSIMLAKIAKFQSYKDTLEAFERMEKVIFVGKEFGIDEFNVLLRAFCAEGKMKEAQSVFQKMHSRFYPNTKTMNILLLGFKESGDVTAVELFYHEMLRRGFKPNAVTYNIRIDTYCKKGCFGDGLRLYEEMERTNCLPTLETINTLIHGAGVARNISKSLELFAEIPKKNLQPDVCAYNALLSSFLKAKDVHSAVNLMNEMEGKNIGLDNVTYHTMFLGLIRLKGIDSVCELYHKMIKSHFIPKARTVVMLMKFFCVQGRVELGLSFWAYLLQGGHCPHGCALDHLITGLCSRGRVQEAFECSIQMLERGRYISEAAFQMLQRFLIPAGNMDRLKMLDQRIKKLRTVLLPSKGHAYGLPASMDPNGMT